MIEGARDLILMLAYVLTCKPPAWPEPGTGAPWTWWAPRNDGWRQ